MILLPHNKHYTEREHITQLPPPAAVILPISQHIGSACTDIKVSVGARVVRGQCIATADAKVYAPIHASITGTVKSITTCPHPFLDRCKAIVIENDYSDETTFAVKRPEHEIEHLSSSALVSIIQDAGIVGLGGAAFPAHLKLTPPCPVSCLIVNCAECEPYLTGDARLVLDKTEEIFAGIGLLRRILNIKKVIIAIEDIQFEGTGAFEIEIYDRGEKDITVKVLPNEYPQGSEKQLVKSCIGKEIPRGKLPFEVGVVVHNVSTIHAIYEAVYLRKPLIDRVVTVSGSCLREKLNLLVPIGTPIKELINRCAVYRDPAKVIMGGPMMGVAQHTLDVPVVKSTGGIVVLTEAEAQLAPQDVCIRCGRCIQHCPMRLMPCNINLAIEKGLWQEAKAYGGFDCIECGSCNYVCPANRTIVQSIRKAKLLMPK